MSAKIQLPEWVYRNLNKYGNCALPKTKYSSEQLRKHLTHWAGKAVRIRSAIFTHFTEHGTDSKGFDVKYYVAEII